MDVAQAQPGDDSTPGDPAKELSTPFESLKLYALVRNASALAVLVLAYSTEWMDLADAGRELSPIRASGASMSASDGARESLVLMPGDLSVFGIPLTVPFVTLLLALMVRVVFSRGRRLHPALPMLLGAVGTVMIGTVLGYAVHDGTASLFTSAFYFALVAYSFNTLFDGFEVLDWRRLRAQSKSR